MMQSMEDTALDIQMHQLSTGQRAADYGFSALWAVDAARSSYFAFLAASTGVGIPLAVALCLSPVGRSTKLCSV